MQCSVQEEHVPKFDTKSAEHRKRFCRPRNSSSLLFPSEWLLCEVMCMRESQRYRRRKIVTKIAAKIPRSGIPCFSWHAPGVVIFKELRL